MSLPAKLPAAIVEPASDVEIVRRVLGGDAPAFELIVRRYNQRLFRVARSILGDDSEAEDVVQEAYVRAYEHLGQFEGRALFSTWLTKIAVYEATARRRKRRRLQTFDSGDLDRDIMDFQSPRPDAAEEASQHELGRLLAGAVDALPAELRVVFAMRMVEAISTNETAECLEITSANVKTRLHRARHLLRAWIDEQIGEEARRLYAFDGARCDRITECVMRRLAPR
jgi:RNA polymerase sigma-70 factor (ECF subfamily)